MNAPARIPASFGLDLWTKGYRVLFRSGETNRCPGCGHSQWLVGRTTAECAVCSTALPLAETELGGFKPQLQRAVALRLIEGASRTDEKRSDEREPGNGRVLSLHVDGCVIPFAIENISMGGVKGSAALDFDGATSLVVELEDGTLLPAELKWAEGQIAGLAFLRT